MTQKRKIGLLSVLTAFPNRAGRGAYMYIYVGSRVESKRTGTGKYNDTNYRYRRR